MEFILFWAMLSTEFIWFFKYGRAIQKDLGQSVISKYFESSSLVAAIYLQFSYY